MAPEGLESLRNSRYHERVSAIVGVRTLSQLCNIHKQDVGLVTLQVLKGYIKHSLKRFDVLSFLFR